MSYNMKKNDLFDNIMYVYESRITNLTATVQSNEIDLDLPRGYVCKVHKTMIRHFNSTDQSSYLINAALVNDPDDENTVAIPPDQVKHDVITDYKCKKNQNAANGFWLVEPEGSQIISYDELDIISARNMRFNAKDDNDNGDSDIECVIWYTIEKVKGSENLLNLLDIL